MRARSGAIIGLAVNYAAILANSLVPSLLLSSKEATSFVSLYSSLMFCGALSRLGVDRWLLKTLVSGEMQSNERAAVGTSLILCVCFSACAGVLLSSVLGAGAVARLALAVLPAVLVATALLAVVLRAQGCNFLPAVSQGGLFSLITLFYSPLQLAAGDVDISIGVLMSAATIAFAVVFFKALHHLAMLSGPSLFKWQLIREQLAFTVVHFLTIFITQGDLVLLPWAVSSEDFITYVLASRLAMATAVPLVIVNFSLGRQLAGAKLESENALLKSSRSATLGWVGVVLLGVVALYGSPVVEGWWEDLTQRAGFRSILFLMALSQLANATTGSVSVWLQFQRQHRVVVFSQIIAIAVLCFHWVACASQGSNFSIVYGFAALPLIWNGSCAIFQISQGRPICDRLTCGVSLVSAIAVAVGFRL